MDVIRRKHKYLKTFPTFSTLCGSMLFTTFCELIPIIVLTALFAICLQTVVTDHCKIFLWASNAQLVPFMDNSMSKTKKS